MDAKKARGFNINLEFEYTNEVPVEKFLTGSEAALGKKDFSQPLKILNKHWVETVADLRLLVQEGQLRSIGLPIRLCVWIETEISKLSKVVDLPPSITPEEVKVVVLDDSPSPPLRETRVFRYESDFDTNGILYWIGTRGGVGPWQNPADQNWLRVTTSGLMENSQPASCFVGREVVRGVTSAMDKAWIAVDLIDKWVKLSHYSLRHYDSWDTEALRDWKLEGSNDSTTWTVLREHKSDGLLRTKGGTATWTITDIGDTFFRIFRVIMTGPNSNNHNYLACSGIEFYGELTLSPPVTDSLVSRSTPRESTWKLSEEKDSSVVGDYIYHHDLDSNGIIFNIGTHGGQRPWVNPGDAGLVVVTASSVTSDSVSLNYVVGRDVVRCVTKPQPNSWISIDLVDKVVIPTHYTLRHYSSWDTEALRTWRFEASNDTLNWTLLMEHKSDQSLRSKGQTFTWILPTKNKREPYRHFRIFQTGENSNGHHYLSLSGFELYGKLLQADGVTPYVFGPLPKTQQQTDFVYTGDFDGRGVIHWLGTNYGTEPWRNPVSRNLVAIRASSLANDSHPAHCVVGQEVVRCVTKPEENSWFVIDLLGRVISPTSYTLRHYSSWDTEALRNWLFQGGNDGVSWTTLREHKDDASLAVKGATHTWTLNTPQRFSMFRIVQTGPNSNNHHYLALSGFELYGVLHGGPTLAKKRSDSGVARSLSSSFSEIPVVGDEKKFSPQTLTSPISGALRATDMVWDTQAKGPSIEVYGKTVVNVGSQDKWQMARSARSFSSGRHLIGLKIDTDPQTSNTWRFIVGVVPATVDASGSTQWVGSKGSWGYISGTGGKCHQKAVSVPYGAKFGVGDVVGIGIDFIAGTVEFYKNGLGQGVAYNKVTGPVYIASSLTGTNSSISFCEWVEPNPSGPLPELGGGVEVDDGLKGVISSSSSSSISVSSSSSVSSGSSSVAGDSELSLIGNLGSWDPENKSKFLVIDSKTGLVKNTGSSDKWQSARSLQTWESGIAEFAVEIAHSPETQNSWRLIVGVVPSSFTCSGSKQWVGAGGSWGFIAGTGGKCFNLPVSLGYGEPWGQTGDVIGVRMDFTAGTLEFLKNGVSQGVAFTTLKGPVHAAVSLTATGSTARLRLNSVTV